MVLGRESDAWRKFFRQHSRVTMEVLVLWGLSRDSVGPERGASPHGLPLARVTRGFPLLSVTFLPTMAVVGNGFLSVGTNR
jgi:hypothetical protein